MLVSLRSGLLAFSSRAGDTNIAHWLYGFGGFFAVYGLIFKDKAAGVAGDAVQAIVDYESRPSLPWWATVVAVAIVAGVLWHFFKA